MVEISGGSRLTGILEKLAKKATSAAAVKVGFLDGSRYPDGKSVAMVAAIQEWGTSRIPPRPFFRTMIKQESVHWGSDVAALLKAHNGDAQATLADMGMEIKAELQMSINGWMSPPNAPSTIARKGFNKPLIDTGLMRDSVDYLVK
jgi:hypothetical protein